MGSGPGTASRGRGGGAGGLSAVGRDLEEEVALATAEETPPDEGPAAEMLSADGATTEERAWTAAEVNSIRAYQGTDFGPVNAALRFEPENLPRYQGMVADLDAMVNGSKLVGDEVLFRGTLLQPFEGVEPGSIIQDAAFASTSRSQVTAMSFAFNNMDPGAIPAVLRIRAPAGTRALNVSKAATHGGWTSGEKEYLLGRGAKLRLDKVTETVSTGAEGWFAGDVYHIVDVTVVP